MREQHHYSAQHTLMAGMMPVRSARQMRVSIALPMPPVWCRLALVEQAIHPPDLLTTAGVEVPSDAQLILTAPNMSPLKVCMSVSEYASALIYALVCLLWRAIKHATLVIRLCDKRATDARTCRYLSYQKALAQMKDTSSAGSGKA